MREDEEAPRAPDAPPGTPTEAPAPSQEPPTATTATATDDDEKGDFTIAADDEVDLRPIDFRVPGKLLPYVKPYRGLVTFGIFLVLARTGAALLGPWLGGRIITAVTQKDAEVATRLAFALLGVQTWLFLVAWAQNYFLTKLGQSVLLDLRRDLFVHVETRASAFFQRWPVGRLVSRVANDVETLAELFSTGIVTLAGDLATVVGIVAVLFATNGKLALAGLSSMPLIIWLAVGFRQPVRKAHREQRRRAAKLAAFLNERITGSRVVRAFGAEAEDQRRFKAVNDEVLAADRRTVHLDGLLNPSIYASSGLAVAALIWFGGLELSAKQVEAGVLFAFLGYVQWLYQPIRDIAEKYTLLQKAMASSERIVELLGVTDDVPDPESPAALPQPIRGELALDRVRFAYVKGAPPALDRVSLEVGAGETLAIVGATGAGKSTIANLIARFWDPEEGVVRLDGIDVKKLSKRDLRRSVALVLQDVFLFAGTIEENVALKPGPLSPEERSRVEAAARAVAAHEVIERLGGYQAVVEERGATLSQGERQLISFARALAQDPKVLLLDEATASLDPETEARLQAGVRALTKGRTAIVIAHRLATVREATRIAVLHRGELRELGTHDELVAKGGLYARLVELQMGSPVRT